MLGALVGLVVGQFRSRASLVAENELLRQQLAAAKSRLQRKRVKFTGSQRLTIALLMRCTASWRTTVTLVQPATVLRWIEKVASTRLQLVGACRSGDEAAHPRARRASAHQA